MTKHAIRGRTRIRVKIYHKAICDRFLHVPPLHPLVGVSGYWSSIRNSR